MSLVLRGGRHFLLTLKKGQECLNFLLAIAQIVAGLHVEVKHKAFYPIAVGAFGTDLSFVVLWRTDGRQEEFYLTLLSLCFIIHL